ncbi:hypothetical protein ACFL6I_05175, partial [candidate division KSB1 bacterium]
SDDLAHPSKFEQQINFLKKNIEYGFVGSAIILIDGNDRETGRWKLSAKAEMIPSIMLFHNYFVNSAVVFRKSVLGDIQFHEGLEIGEDYFLLWLLLQKSKAINLPDHLTYYRQHNESQMHRIAESRMKYDSKVYENIFKQSDIEVTQDELKVHIGLKEKEVLQSWNQLKKNRLWLLKLWYHFNRLNLHKNSSRKVILNRWLKVSFKARRNPLLFLSVIFNLTFYYSILFKNGS